MEASDGPYDRGSELALGDISSPRVPIHGLIVHRMCAAMWPADAFGLFSFSDCYFFFGFGLLALSQP